MQHLRDIRPQGHEPYAVLCGEDAPDALASLWPRRWTRAVVIGDETTSRLYGEPIARALEARSVPVLQASFPPGESSKTRATKERLEDVLLSERVDRHACVVAVGGGVALDLAGFLAATYLRGIAHVNVATSLLAQVDAAIGGKTGVNTTHGKNLVGAFHHPRAVLLDVGALATLPRADLRAGLAETVKHAALADEALFEALESHASGEFTPDESIVARSVAIKAAVVEGDPEERGRRAILNFGHTVAHAIEAATSGVTSHGEAVAIGMVIEARLAVAKRWLPEGDASRLERLLAALDLPVRAACPFDEAAPFFAGDKKNRGAGVECAIPSRLGTISSHDGRWTRTVTADDLRDAWS